MGTENIIAATKYIPYLHKYNETKLRDTSSILKENIVLNICMIPWRDSMRNKIHPIKIINNVYKC